MLLPVIGDGLVEGGVLLLSDIVRFPHPNGLHVVEVIPFMADLLDLLGLLFFLGLLFLIDFFNLGFVIVSIILIFFFVISCRRRFYFYLAVQSSTVVSFTIRSQK